MADNNRQAQLTLLIKEAGAKETAAEIQKLAATTTTVQQELGKLSRTDQLRQLGADMGALAVKTKDVGAAVTDLSKKLAALGASKDEIRDVTSAFNAAQSGGAGGSGPGPGGNLLQRIGAQGRNLPSVQIPGAGIGTDAISNLVRLTGALGEVSGAAKAITTVTTILTPALGATAAGFAGIAAVAGPLILIAGVLGLALKSIGDQAAEEAKAINAIVEGQREIAQRIAEGLTSQQAAEELEVLNKKRKEEAELLARNQRVYDENVNSQTILQGVVKLTSGAEEELASQIAKGTDLVKTYDNDIKSLTAAQEDGSLAANDAAEAEKKLADERSKSTLTAADIAGKELQAQQKALSATAEQNEKRLTSIEDEKAVIEKQIEVLTASGVTSEEVTKKIEALNGQLGSLGNESDFIKNTALEQSRARDAEKKAAKDAEDVAKKAAQAQEQYTKAVAGAMTTYKNSAQDIGIRLKQALEDNVIKLNRDLLALETKSSRDEFDLTLKANRDERNTLLKQADDLADIRRDAAKEEQKALQDGDFKALFLARQKGAEDIQADKDEIQKANALRQLGAQDAREDLRRSIGRQREDRLSGYRYQETDAFAAQRREMQQASLTRSRALQVASEGQNAELKMLGSYWNARLKVEQQGLDQSLKLAAGSGPNAPRTKANYAFAQSFTTAVRR
jgi:hypothetical protein